MMADSELPSISDAVFQILKPPAFTLTPSISAISATFVLIIFLVSFFPVLYYGAKFNANVCVKKARKKTPALHSVM